MHEAVSKPFNSSEKLSGHKEDYTRDAIASLSLQLQQKNLELQNEKQVSETWITELEVTSKAYDSEKKKNKQLLQQVELYHNT